MSEGEDLHPIFTKDPEEWMQFVYKKVSVLTEDGMEHVGLVYTVDPVSESLVLISFNEEKTKVQIIVGSSISSMQILSENTEVFKPQLDDLFRPHVESKLSQEELKAKQGLIKSWLLKHRLPVEEGGVNGELLSVADVLMINPPYEPENCVSTNEIILGKIQGLLKNMPPDHSQW